MLVGNGELPDTGELIGNGELLHNDIMGSSLIMWLFKKSIEKIKVTSSSW